MTQPLRNAAAALLAAVFSHAACAEPALGRVETLYVAMSQHLLVEMTPGMRTHDRPLVAGVRLRDAGGAPARQVFLRVEADAVEAGDIVAVSEAERGALRTAPLRARDRLLHVEARRDTELARNFFQTRPGFLALRQD
ncbi:MAG: hypothetical protein JNM90_11180 [Burkholderiales bacterium]|nr:hypothetical protein [Burkholderiales bacterium]